MSLPLKNRLKKHFKASDAEEIEVIQSLWSGYGTISRWKLVGANVETVIVKQVSAPKEPSHPRGWNSAISHERKLRSYEIEMEWYITHAPKTNSNCRVPTCYFFKNDAEEQIMILEDLDACGFNCRRSQLSLEEAKLGLEWLAHFHANFMHAVPVGLWQQGTYWHLETRPDEREAMRTSWLKTNAQRIDEKLKTCKFQTIVHGDAKVANFCFSTDMQSVAAVDFQYVGGGCGMKDVVYFLGSCLTEEHCKLYEVELLDYYFKILKQDIKSVDVDALEKEWRAMCAIAWADFTRFLMGWMPEHQKINNYSLSMVERAKEVI